MFAGAKGVCLRQGVSRSEVDGWSWGEGYLEMGISIAGQVVVWGESGEPCLNRTFGLAEVAPSVSLRYTLASGVAGIL